MENHIIFIHPVRPLSPSQRLEIDKFKIALARVPRVVPLVRGLPRVRPVQKKLM